LQNSEENKLKSRFYLIFAPSKSYHISFILI